MSRSCPLPSPVELEPAHDRSWHSIELAHDELGGAGDLVGTAISVACSSYPVESCRPLSDREADETPDTPSATSVVPRRKGRPKESLTMTPTSTSDTLANPLSRRRCRGRRPDREGAGSACSGPLRVRLVDPRRGTDEPMARLGDDERRRPRAHDPTALLEDHLDAACVLRTGELARPGGRLNFVEMQDASFHLRDRLLSDDDDVSVARARTPALRTRR